jgi:hypothetical protein
MFPLTDPTPVDETQANDTRYERGLDKHKPFLVSHEADCLSELNMVYLANHRNKDKISKKVGHVQDICGTTRRLLLKVWVQSRSGLAQYWVDDVTGTMYTSSGECMSSDKRRVVKWVRYRASEWEKRKRVVYDEPTFDWNQGI